MKLKLQELTSKKNDILLNIIYLISEEDRWYSVEEISTHIRLVERSVQRYMNELYDTINDFNDNKKNKITLLLKKNKGVKLITKQNGHNSVLINFILTSDENIQTLISLLLNNHRTLQDYSKTTKKTISSIRYSLNKLKMKLQPLDLDISINDFTIIGCEIQIRFICYCLAWQLFNSDTWPNIFFPIDNFKMENVMDEILKPLHLDITPIKKRKLTYMAAINILRFRHGHPVTYQDQWEKYIPSDSQFELNTLSDNFYHEFEIYSHSEAQFFVLNLMMDSICYESIPIKKKIINHHRIHNSDVITSTDLFMKLFNDKISLISSQDYSDVFIYILRCHLLGKIYKHIHFDNRKHSATKNYDSKQYIHKMSDFIEELFLSSNNDLFLEKDYLCQVYFMLLPLNKIKVTFEKKIFLHLESDLPIICVRNIEKSIYTLLKNEYNLTFIRNPNLQKPDIVLTNMCNGESNNSSIHINYPLSDRNIYDLKKIMSNIKKTS